MMETARKKIQRKLMILSDLWNEEIIILKDKIKCFNKIFLFSPEGELIDVTYITPGVPSSFSPDEKPDEGTKAL